MLLPDISPPLYHAVLVVPLVFQVLAHLHAVLGSVVARAAGLPRPEAGGGGGEGARYAKIFISTYADLEFVGILFVCLSYQLVP